ncbi:MAG: hypothetical protein OQK69_12340 [Gammaproteobacteria bacterium]|nr:hypothetical protein [Gammaproteobacteria bacterium]
MKISTIKIIALWLIIGPALALIFSTLSWYIIEYLTPGKLAGIDVLFSQYILALLLSVMTPWGWLIYGGFLLMMTKNLKMGVSCTLIGALLLGGFWPIWATDLASA